MVCGIWLNLRQGQQEIDSYWFTNAEDRDRARVIISGDPMPWISQYIDNADDMVAVPVKMIEDQEVKLNIPNILRQGTDDRPMTQEEVDSDDFSVCVACTLTSDGKAVVYHRGKRKHVSQDDLDGMDYGALRETYQRGMIENEPEDLTDEVLRGIASYAFRLVRERVFEVQEFLAKVTDEVNRGIRVPANDEIRVPTIIDMSIQTDKSGYPMFPDEIRDWLEATRAKFELPNIVRSLRHGGIPMNDQMTMEEMLLFCLHMEDQHPGSGMYVFGGRLV
jgi:hypothetical protein